MATPEYPGNVIPMPGYYDGSQSVDDELLYSTEGFFKKGVTLKPGQGVLLLGTFLDQDSATKKYVKTTTAGNVKGVLYQSVDTGTDPNGKSLGANILYGGMLKLSKVSAANSGVTLTSVLNARVNTIAGFFKF